MQNRSVILNDNDQLFLAKEYAPLIVAYHNGAPVRLSDVATVIDGQANSRNAGIDQWQARRAASAVPPAVRKHH